MRALLLFALLVAGTAVLASGVEAAEYLRGVAFIALLALYVAVGLPAYRAPREGG